MADKSKIEWTDATWNPIRGCSVVSEGCRNCYAMTTAARFTKPGEAYEGLAYRNESGAHWTGQVKLIEEHLNDPLRWKRPRRIFVNSMSDLFHESLSFGQIFRVFAVMQRAPQHTFQVLTKRPARMKEFLEWLAIWGVPTALAMGIQEYYEWPYPNTWIGVSVEDQATFDERWPYLRDTPAWTRWLSLEPLLGPINAAAALQESHYYCDVSDEPDDPTPAHRCAPIANWIVVGGESGSGARPMHPDWARSLRDQCVAAGVPFFFKQWGEWKPILDNVRNYSNGYYFPRGNRDYVRAIARAARFHGGTALISPRVNGDIMYHEARKGDFCPEVPTHTLVEYMVRVGKQAAGRLLDGREWNEYPVALGGA